MTSSDTIAAIASAPANGAIGVIRLSGPHAEAILKKIFRDKSGAVLSHVAPRVVHFGVLVGRNGCFLDQVLAFYLPMPHTFTGEDVVEINCHGNLYLMRQILREIISFDDVYPVRLAEAGEFSKRAFLNGKMDLTQAEAIHELISAQSEAAVKMSLSNLDKRLKIIVDSLRDSLKLALALVEASFEFAHEDIQTYDKAQLLELVKKSHNELQLLKNAYQTSKLYDNGVTVAIVGRPNVGKSSLLNALLYEERAIVTDIPGTTRDVVEGVRVINGVRFILRDTAGIRESLDHVESIGIERARGLVENSDIVLFVVDDLTELSDGVNLFRPDSAERHFIFNKFDKYLGNFCDLSLDELQSRSKKLKMDYSFSAVVSATQPFGIQEIEQIFEKYLNVQKNVHNNIHINERQHGLVQFAMETAANIILYMKNIDRPISEEIIAEELKSIINYLSEITGEINNDMVLSEIFSRFCIGK